MQMGAVWNVGLWVIGKYPGRLGEKRSLVFGAIAGILEDELASDTVVLDLDGPNRGVQALGAIEQPDRPDPTRAPRLERGAQLFHGEWLARRHAHKPSVWSSTPPRFVRWRRGRDSNPGSSRIAGFQDQCFRPLSHLSEAARSISERVAPWEVGDRRRARSALTR